MTKLFLLLIRGYQLSLARVLPPSCRYYPSCSHYTYEAIDRYGWLRAAGWERRGSLAATRLPQAATTLSPDPDFDLTE